MKVLLRAPLLSRSGYGVHSRQVFRYLLQNPNLEIKTQIVPWGVTPWCVDHQAENGLIGEALSRSINSTDENFDVSVQVQLPNEWDPKLAKYNIGMTAGVETDRCSDAWIGSINQMDKVIVPTEFAKNTFLNSGKVTTDVDVVAECFDEEMAECNKPLQVDFDTSFNFLIFHKSKKNIANYFKSFNKSACNCSIITYSFSNRIGNSSKAIY